MPPCTTPRSARRAQASGAVELLIDRATGRVTREPGPGMMWSTRCGMMAGGMIGGGGFAGAGPMTWRLTACGPPWRRRGRALGGADPSVAITTIPGYS